MSAFASGLNPLLAFAAGGLTILSPCVLPLLPITLGSAAASHRGGALAMGAGLVLSFAGAGLLLATLGITAGLDGDLLRVVSAWLLLLAGLVLLVPALQALLSRAAGPLASWAYARQSKLGRHGLIGQGLVGVLMGLVWSPCVGPTLGAATVLAAQGSNLGEVALTMFAFGLGIASVLLLVGLGARSALRRWNGSLLATGARGKRLLGASLALAGAMVLTGFDHRAEAELVRASPDWLVALTTSL